jgi:hypothetical protein
MKPEIEDRLEAQGYRSLSLPMEGLLKASPSITIPAFKHKENCQAILSVTKSLCCKPRNNSTDIPADRTASLAIEGQGQTRVRTVGMDYPEENRCQGAKDGSTESNG